MIALRNEDGFHLAAIGELEEPFARAIGGQQLACNARPSNCKVLGEERTHIPCNRHHGTKIGGPPMVDPVPDLAHTRGVDVHLLEFRDELRSGKANDLDFRHAWSLTEIGGER